MTHGKPAKVEITPLHLLEHSPVLEDQLVCAIAFAEDDSIYDLCLKESMEGCDWLTNENHMALLRAAAKACIKVFESQAAPEKSP